MQDAGDEESAKRAYAELYDLREMMVAGQIEQGFVGVPVYRNGVGRVVTHVSPPPATGR